jgi:N-acetylneuraminate synthase
MDKDDLKLFWQKWDKTQELLGSFEVAALQEEEPARKNARRSLVAAKAIPAGKKIEESDLTWKRPAHGISPKFMVDLIGQTASNDIEEDTVLQWRYFQG